MQDRWRFPLPLAPSIRRRLARRRDRALWRRGWYDPDARSDLPVVFIGGCSRSGTTLLREILDRHSDLAADVETALFVPAFDTGRIAHRAALDRRALDRLAASSPNLLAFAEAYFERFVRGHGASRWVEKSPHLVRVAHQLLVWLPRARFLHVVRDGRDVACSLRHHPREVLVDGKIRAANTTRSFARCCHEWVEETRLGLDLHDHPRTLEVRYEALVTAPEETIRGVCAFIGEEYRPAMLEPGRPPSGPPARLINNPHAAGAISDGRVGRWRSDMTVAQRRTFVAIAGDLLVELGYVADHAWVGEPPTARAEARTSATDLLRRELARGRRRARLTASGGCMAPLIRDGDEVIVEPLATPPARGAVVVCETEPGELVCHRVLDHRPDGVLVIAGDRSGAPDAVTAADLVGLVRHLRRGPRQLALAGPLSRLSSWLHTHARGRPHPWRRALLRRSGAAISRLRWLLARRAGP